jgi:glycosyltransferase involved in cell wall biosynthesis
VKIFIAGPAYPYRGGIAAYNERLAAEFMSEGHDVEIITFRLQYPSLLFPGKSQYVSGPAPKEVRISRLINTVNPFNWILAGLRIRREVPDILILRYWIPFLAPSLGTIARIVTGNRHTKVICLFDNVVPHEKRIGDTMLTAFFVRSVQAAVTMSQTVTDDLLKFRRSIPFVETPHPLFDNFGEDPGREASLKKLGLDKSFRYILFFGFIREYKGLDLLLEAFAASEVRKVTKVKLIVAGEFYESREKYLKIIAKEVMQEDIIMIDRFIDDEEVRYIFGASDLVVQPYKSATQSGVTQIAYHFNKPMIVTNVGGLKEIVPDGKCGFVVEPSADSIQNAIDRFFSSDLSTILMEGIEIQKKKYGWDRLTASIIELATNL